MVRVGSSNLEEPVKAAAPPPKEHKEKKDKKKDKKQKKDKAKSEVDGTQGADGSPSESEVMEEFHEAFAKTPHPQEAMRATGGAPEWLQESMAVGDKVGLPPRVRFVQNCVRKVKENGRDENTVIVGVDDMEILFEFFGYPV